MILWILKQLGSVRQAIAGRKYPHQLAWAVAFGFLLGVVPHGNLLAIAIMIVVLSLKINHAMAALTAVCATFLATWIDPYAHRLGDYVLTHPQADQTVANLWQMPLVPWTDLNNTVVLGSFLLGLCALLPLFVFAYPVFRYLAPALISESEHEPAGTEDRLSQESTHEVIMIDQGHHGVSARQHESRRNEPDSVAPVNPFGGGTEGEADNVDFVEVDPDADTEDDNCVAVETRIDVIRMKDYRSVIGENEDSRQADESDSQQPMDEALNYLLRQLRDSQQRKAA